MSSDKDKLSYILSDETKIIQGVSFYNIAEQIVLTTFKVIGAK